jgi:serine/threonine-protein kinase
MAYEMLCGERPFSASSVMDILLMHRDEKPLLPSLASPWLGIPRAIESLIMSALEKNPDERIQTASEMKSGLEGLPAWCAPPIPAVAAFAPTVLDQV